MGSGVYTHTHSHIDTFVDESDYNKPGLWPARAKYFSPESELNRSSMCGNRHVSSFTTSLTVSL